MTHSDTDDSLGTGYLNCETRIFNFTEESTSLDAHLVESEESPKSRTGGVAENNPFVPAEMTAISS